jgi:hypothetical protein
MLDTQEIDSFYLRRVEDAATVFVGLKEHNEHLQEEKECFEKLSANWSDEQLELFKEWEMAHYGTDAFELAKTYKVGLLDGIALVSQSA